MPVIFQLMFGVALTALAFDIDTAISAAIAKQPVRALIFGIIGAIVLIGLIFFLFVH